MSRPSATGVIAAASVAMLAVLAGVAGASHQAPKNGCTSKAPVAGALTFAGVPANARSLAFRTYWEIESVNPVTFDQLIVEASTDGGTTFQQLRLLNPTTSPGGQPDRPFSNAGLFTPPSWEAVAVDLPPSTTHIRFRFASGDSEHQGFRGWVVDDVTLTDPIEPAIVHSENFEGAAPGWSFSGFWHIQANPERVRVKNPEIDPTLVTLPDDGFLLADEGPTESRVAWFGQAETGTYCGADFAVEPPAIVLEPSSAQRAVGETHTVTALTQNAGPGAVVRFSITGANPGSDAVPVDPESGRAATSWTGAEGGTDFVAAHLDLNGDGIQDPGEPSGFATVDWFAAAPGPPPDDEPPPSGDQPPPPPPPPPQPTSPVTQIVVLVLMTIDRLPDPEPFREVNVEPVAGEVLVRLPGGSGFIPLSQAAQLPVGTIFETTRGRVRLESAANASGSETQTAEFFGGMFKVGQRRAAQPVTELVLTGGSFRGCPARGQRAQTAGRRRGRRVRRLWGNGRGRFRTRGRYSAATVRGTIWVTEDHCNGTLTRLPRRPRTNRLLVRDFARRANITLRAGQSHFAFAPLRR